MYSAHGEPKDQLKVVSYPVTSKPENNQVVIKLLAAPINPADINQIEGVYPSKPPMEKILGSSEPIAVGGNEGVFEVVAVGDNVKGFKVGDWTIPIEPNFGTWRTYAAVESSLLNTIPNENLSPLAAATVSVNPATAYYLLTKFAKLNKGDWFIQNGGTSGVGRAAVQLAKQWGINSISVIRDREDFDQVASELKDLGATEVITEEQAGDRQFKGQIKSWVGKSSIKLALNCVGGSSCTNISRQLSANGHLVTYGGMSKRPVTLPTSLFIFKNLTAHGYWLTAQTKQDPAAKLAIVHDILKMYQTKQFKDVPLSTHEIADSSSDESVLQAFLDAISTKGKKQVVVYK